KNSLFLTIGPPTLPPNWFFRSSGFFGPSLKFRASSASLRRNSSSDPWKSLLPDFVDALITAPLPPNCALYVFTSVLNSLIASTPMAVPRLTAPDPWFQKVFSDVSSNISTAPSGRDPATEYVLPLP